MKSYTILFILVLLSFTSFAQKNKKKAGPDLNLKIDSLSQRLGESKQQNEKLLLENEMLGNENDKMKKEVSDLSNELNQLRRKVSEQESELKKIEDDILAKEAAKKAETQTTIQFESIEINFGEVKEGTTVSKIYKLKNTGKKRLMIEKVEGSCGCTVAEWPRYPVEPGENAEIKVNFNTLGKRGDQDKSITVTANTEPALTILRIKGKVLAE
jgi:TolA-binding protein